MSDHQARQFLERFACDELAEIELAQAAVSRARAEIVRDFAGRMIKLHREWVGEIHRLDQRLALHLEIHLDSHRMADVAALAAQEGSIFDAQYLAHEVKWFNRMLRAARGLGPAKEDEVLLYLARQLELLEVNLHLAQHTQAALTLIDFERSPKP